MAIVRLDQQTATDGCWIARCVCDGAIVPEYFVLFFFAFNRPKKFSMWRRVFDCRRSLVCMCQSVGLYVSKSSWHSMFHCEKCLRRQNVHHCGGRRISCLSHLYWLVLAARILYVVLYIKNTMRPNPSLLRICLRLFLHWTGFCCFFVLFFAGRVRMTSADQNKKFPLSLSLSLFFISIFRLMARSFCFRLCCE